MVNCYFIRLTDERGKCTFQFTWSMYKNTTINFFLLKFRKFYDTSFYGMNTLLIQFWRLFSFRCSFSLIDEIIIKLSNLSGCICPFLKWFFYVTKEKSCDLLSRKIKMPQPAHISISFHSISFNWIDIFKIYYKSLSQLNEYNHSNTVIITSYIFNLNTILMVRLLKYQSINVNICADFEWLEKSCIWIFCI